LTLIRTVVAMAVIREEKAVVAASTIGAAWAAERVAVLQVVGAA
jgi:hypothetical protein